MPFTKLLAAKKSLSFHYNSLNGKRARGIERTITRYEIGMVCSMQGMMRNVRNTSANKRKTRYPYENVGRKIE
jgi:hypothetical protein